MALKIVGWTDFDCSYPTPKVTGEEFSEMLQLIREEIYEHGYIFAGQDHQNSATGVPVFSNGTCFRASWRAWGSIMAQMYTDSEGNALSYMDFYMSLGDNAVMPEWSPIDVTPAVVENLSVGCTLKQDRQIVDESLAMGMPFITMDVVLQNYYEKKKQEQQ